MNGEYNLHKHRIIIIHKNMESISYHKYREYSVCLFKKIIFILKLNVSGMIL